MTEYQKLLEAVANYYGAGSDQWTTIATSSNITSAEWASILKQTPNVNVITNKAGDIVSYTVKDTFGTTADTITGTVNSNTQVATMANAADINVPANTTAGSQSVVAAESGMKAVSTGTSVATVVKNVALGVAAVSAGCKVGAAVDAALYNHDPDFWDAVGMSSLNPETWDSICTTQAGKDVFNFVFGINKNSGETQAYMDERALAYIVQYLISQDVFDPQKYVEVISYPDREINEPIYAYELPVSLPTVESVCNMGLKVCHNDFNYDYYASANMGGVYLVMYGNDNTTCYFSKNQNAVVYGGIREPNVLYAVNVNTLRTVDDHTYYTSGNSYIFNQPNSYIQRSALQSQSQDVTNITLLALYTLFGEVEQMGGVEGITNQPNAVLPTGITPSMSIDDVIAQLQILYPDMFDDAIYNDVLQDDGTTTRYIYVPVPMPDTVPVDEITGKLKPTGGTDMSQDDTVIDEDSPADLIDTLLKILTSPDPYNPTNITQDVDTDYPDTGDGNTPAVIIPTGSASALYSIYNPSQSQLNSLGAWLWSSNFVDQLLKLFNDPMQAIIGLHKIFATPPTSGTGTIKVGYLDSGVGSNLVSAQYTEIDCGSVNLKEYFGNVLDYTHTDVYIYLPFVGIVPLNVSDVMRSKIEVKYKVDVLTGACLASVNVFRDNNAGGQLYVYAGNCAAQYPLSSGSYMGIVAGILGIAGSVAGTMLSGGALLPMALGAGASALNSAKTKVEHGGALSGNSGAMGIKKPYLIIRRPQTHLADNFNVLDGIAENVYGVLGSYTGFTRVKYIHLENINATDEELTQIEEILKSGVMI